MALFSRDSILTRLRAKVAGGQPIIGVGTWDNTCTNKTVGGLGEVMETCASPGKQNSYPCK